MSQFIDEARCLVRNGMLSLIFAAAGACVALAQSNHNQPPINYDTAEPNDPVAKLIEQISSRSTEIKWDDDHGWLPDLLRQLDIPQSSQTLVFSKTSQQLRRINPSRPRAIYFSDDVYIGLVKSGDFLEIGAVDPVQGAIFYTLDQAKSDQALIKRASTICLSCHETHKTHDVPGFLVRSVYPKSDGHPEFRLGTTTTDHTTPFKDRFGGWYITGNHGEMRHRGNAMIDADSQTEATALDREPVANRESLPDRVNSKAYLEPTSDIVAMMILEHQSQFHNLVTRASYETRQALHYQAEMNRILDREPDFRSDSTERRINTVAERLVEYLFFSNEYKLTAPISGSAKFVEDFSAKAIRDSNGRSLRELDLTRRLLKYPCSYLIYTESFCSLPDPVLKIVLSRMNDVLSGRDESDAFDHLSSDDRKAILEILTETHPLFRAANDDSDTKSN